jgi:hypothetical protein
MQITQKSKTTNVINNDFNSNQSILNNWNFSRLKAYVLKDNPELVDVVDIHLKQYKIYLLLCSVSNKPMSVPGEKVDNIWHHHLCLNKDYNQLTKQLCGRILRHEPSLPGDENNSNNINNLVEASFHYYGEFVFDINLINHKGCSDCDGNGCMTCHGGGKIINQECFVGCDPSCMTLNSNCFAPCDGGPCTTDCTGGN